MDTDKDSGKVATEESTWPCLLCKEVKGEIIARLSGIQLRSLWAAMEKQFSPEAMGAVQPETQVILKRCHNCGFVSNNPSLAGGEQFYRELNQADDYATSRQEFARTVNFARANHLKRVLDVGCGSGTFLDEARTAGLETHGLELNSAAAAVAREKGHRIFSTLLGEVAQQSQPPVFDLITFFQVVEHLPAPVDVLRDALKLLRPGGYIAIAVPSAEGVYRLSPWDPAQWPPHHISRWRRTDFDQLARVLGLRLVECGGDQLYGTSIEYFWKLHNQLAPVLGHRSYWGGDIAAKWISFVYRKAGLKHLCCGKGNSLYAFLTHP